MLDMIHSQQLRSCRDGQLSCSDNGPGQTSHRQEEECPYKYFDDQIFIKELCLTNKDQLQALFITNRGYCSLILLLITIT